MRRVRICSRLSSLKTANWFVMAALAVAIAAAYTSSAEVDIDYSHNLIGIGTVMTDFKMGSEEDTLAIGRVRGSGEVINRYTFISNNSENVSIEDQFIFQDLREMPATHELVFRDYPPMAGVPGSLRLLGTSWAGKINLTFQ